MNKDKAIQLLERLQDPEPYEPMLTKDAYDAIQMAIDALSADGDTISRKAAIEICDNAIDLLKWQFGAGALAAIKESIEELPPTQPKRIKARWLPIGMADAVGGESAMWGDKIAYHVCEKCWKQALERDGEEVLSDFCPNCGAEMEVTT